MKLLKILPFFLLLSSLSAENILFIGNSYTGGIKKTVTELFKKQNSNSKIEYISPGGKNLMFHVKNPKTIDKIKNGNWDKIVLQDQSQTPALPGYNKIFHDATAEFTKLFKTLKKQPKVYYYMTWGRRDGDKKIGKIQFLAKVNTFSQNRVGNMKHTRLSQKPKIPIKIYLTQESENSCDQFEI